MVSQEQATKVCRNARQAISFLNGCGIKNDNRLEIRIVNRLSDDLVKDAFAAFFPKTNRIEVVSPDIQARMGAQTPVVRDLDPEIFWRSSVIHEVAQAMAWNYAKSNGVTLREVEVEYVAYSAQIASLPTEQKNVLLRKFQDRDGIAVSELDPLVLAIAPIIFGIKSFLHYNENQGGCSFLRKVMSGKSGMPP